MYCNGNGLSPTEKNVRSDVAVIKRPWPLVKAVNQRLCCNVRILIGHYLSFSYDKAVFDYSTERAGLEF
jgi:hypothetical protein